MSAGDQREFDLIDARYHPYSKNRHYDPIMPEGPRWISTQGLKHEEYYIFYLKEMERRKATAKVNEGA